MAWLPRPVSPRAAWRDAIQFLRQRRRHQLVFAALSVAIPIALILGFIDEFNRSEVWQPPTIVYAEQWSTARTRAEIAAQQARDLPRERAEAARLAKAKAERQAQFQRAKQRLKALGI